MRHFSFRQCITPVPLSGSFVADVVCIYYTSDERVQADEEVQAFIKDVCSFGMQDFDHCGGCTLQVSCCIISFSNENAAANKYVKSYL